MGLGTIVDLAILAYIIYNIYLGAKNGLVKTIFISFGFIINSVLTYFVYINFSKVLLQDKNVNSIIEYIRNFVLKYMPKLSSITDILNTVILIFMVYFTISLIVSVIYIIMQGTVDKTVLKWSDKLLGSIFGALKSVVITMLVVYGFDKFSDYTITPQVKDALANSMILPKFYLYNIFMNLFVN